MHRDCDSPATHDATVTVRGKVIPARVSVTWRHDWHSEGDYLGTFTETWEPGAVKVPKGDARRFAGFNRTEAPTYFVPCNSYESARRWYRAHGYARHVADCEARRQVREDMRRLLSLGIDWSYVGCEVTASALGVEGGDALWGIESDSDDSFLTETERDCERNALAELSAQLETIGETLAV